jgi:DNA (cytosine-5)-methyltransferase 1
VPALFLYLERQGLVSALVIRRVGGGFTRLSIDEPAPTVMADGLGGVCRRGWQYWLEGTWSTMPANMVPRESSIVDPREIEGCDEMRVKVWMEHSAGHDNGAASHRNFEGRAHHFVDVTDRPCEAITCRPSAIVVEQLAGEEHMPETDKPPYRVPLMAEVVDLPWNGFSVASLFAGTGGSSTGYRMAGFRVVYANEFVEAARDSYRANMRPGTILDHRDIRTVTPEDILQKIGMAPGELDVLDGSPPCASFSTAGKREEKWGKSAKYSDTDQRSDDLFFEFARILGGMQPKAFVAENVSGLVKGVAKGYFLDILGALKSKGYRVEARLLDAQWLGVPQARQRLIFVGVRDDLGLSPAHPLPLRYRYSIRDALPWITRVGRAPGGDFDKKGDDLVWGGADAPAPTITAKLDGTAGRTPSPLVCEGEQLSGKGHRREDEGGARRLIVDPSQPAPTVMAGGVGNVNTGQYTIEEEIIATGANGRFGEATWQTPDEPARTIGSHPNSGNGRAGGGDVVVIRHGTKSAHSSIRGDALDLDRPISTVLAGGPTQFELEQKVEFCLKESEARKIQPADSVPDNVGATLEGYAIGAEWDRLAPGGQSDKYFSLVKPDADRPSPTVTASGGGAGSAGVAGSIAGVTHPTEKRKFTIAELRRVCGFPDDFVLTGTYAQQWERLGRAVPPVMMRAVAEVVRDSILAKIPRPEPAPAPVVETAPAAGAERAARPKVARKVRSAVGSGEAALRRRERAPESGRGLDPTGIVPPPVEAGRVRAGRGEAAAVVAPGKRRRVEPKGARDAEPDQNDAPAFESVAQVVRASTRKGSGKNVAALKSPKVGGQQVDALEAVKESRQGQVAKTRKPLPGRTGERPQRV